MFRSLDGLLLIVSSSDGFCSIISFSKEELGIPYYSEIQMMETEESVLEDIDEVPIKDIELKIKPREDEKEKNDFSEPHTKKRVQLVTLSSPKNKKYLNK